MSLFFFLFFSLFFFLFFLFFSLFFFFFFSFFSFFPFFFPFFPVFPFFPFFVSRKLLSACVPTCQTCTLHSCTVRDGHTTAFWVRSQEKRVLCVIRISCCLVCPGLHARYTDVFFTCRYTDGGFGCYSGYSKVRRSSVFRLQQW